MGHYVAHNIVLVLRTVTTHTTFCYILYSNKNAVLPWYDVFPYFKCIIFYQVLNVDVAPEDHGQLPKYVREDSVSAYVLNP